MLLYIIQREGRDASPSVKAMPFHIPSSLLIYVTTISPYHPTASSTSCLHTNSTYTTSHSLVHLKHNLTQPRPILGIQQHSSLYQFSTIIFQNNKRGAPRGVEGGGAQGGVQGGTNWRRMSQTRMPLFSAVGALDEATLLYCTHWLNDMDQDHLLTAI
jgi:hypothetical protein